ncbi:hypothetical protein O3M35_006119 [Rhynocoris fuscipes]|uniref:Uncharacterized protein n=1 Tax=Rhynocoris fuscipes TaxID=488301 RepID=A0AAW1DJE6_9HEMI
MNSREYQNSYDRKSNEYGRKRWEQNQRTNNQSRRSRLQEKRLKYRQSKNNARSKNQRSTVNYPDIQRKQQQRETNSPRGANETVTSCSNYNQTGEIIFVNDNINTSSPNSFSLRANFSHPSNNSPSINKSQENLNITSTNQSIQNQSVECEQDIKHKTISNLLNEVCNEAGTNVSNIASKFFQALVTELLSLTDSLPEQRSFIYNILSTLVDLGMRCAHKEINQENVSESQVPENNTSEDNYFKDLHSLINVDYRLQSLLKERIDLYGNIYNIMRRVQKDPNDASNSDDIVVQNSIGNFKRETAAIAESFNNLQSTIIQPNELNSNNCNENLTQTTTNQNENQQTTSKECDNIQNSSSFIRNNTTSTNPVNETVINQSFGLIQSTELQCFCINDQVLIGGYKNGSILIFCLETGTLLDNVQPHKKPITSITVKDNILITTSLDGIMKKYDLKNHTVKKINLEQGINCSCRYRDIIYLGTNSGYIFRVTIREMKQFSTPLCVSKEAVLSIEVKEEENVLLMFIAAKGLSISIRDGITGSLLYIFANTQNARSIMLLKEPLRLCAGFDDKLLIREVHHTATAFTIKPHLVSCMMLYSGIIFIATKEHQIFIYDEKTVTELFVISDVPKHIRGMAVWLDYLIIVSAKGFKFLKIPKLVLQNFCK